MTSALTVAVVQMSSMDDVGRNLDEASRSLRAAARAGARLVTFPENVGFQAGDRDKLRYAAPVEQHSFLAPLRELARELDVYVLAGSIPERGPDPEHVYNTSVLLGPRGETIASYRKIHLFDVDLSDELSLRESSHVTPGEQPVVAEVDGWKVGLTVCYDVRFPELYRRYALDGADILTVPAAFTLHTGKDHWEILLRARAIENQAFVLAPAQWGRCGPGRVSWGKSMIIDPWGAVLASAPERTGFALATLEHADLERVRRELPALKNRTAPGKL